MNDHGSAAAGIIAAILFGIMLALTIIGGLDPAYNAGSVPHG